MSTLNQAIETLKAARLAVIEEMNNCDKSWEPNKIRSLQVKSSQLADGIGMLIVKQKELGLA